MTDYWRNASGYYDETATKAIDNIDKENRPSNRDVEVKQLIRDLKTLAGNKNFKICNRMIIKDLQNDKIYR